jgi:hypothetical protein
MSKKKSLWLWLLSFLLTIILAVYQRLSGPSYPFKGTETLAAAKVSYKFYRSWTSGRELPVQVTISGENISARLYYRHYPLLDGENWTIMAMEKKAGTFQGAIPSQPPAGKVLYKVEASSADQSVWLNNGRPMIARFKGEVPAALLIMHIIFMFAGLLLAFRTGLEALRHDGRWQKLLPWTLAVVCAGGLILGPLVQYNAFGTFWTGFPLGGDLTDSKTLLAVLVWVGAFFLRNRSRWWTLAATALMIAVYLVPHSLLGSEFNYQTGKVETSAGIRSPSIK